METTMKDRHVPTHDANPDIRTTVLDAIKGIRYGSVEIVIHDGKVVQIERKEKVRIGTTLPH
jgi:hypothetical protein